MLSTVIQQFPGPINFKSGNAQFPEFIGRIKAITVVNNDGGFVVAAFNKAGILTGDFLENIPNGLTIYGDFRIIEAFDPGSNLHLLLYPF